MGREKASKNNEGERLKIIRKGEVEEEVNTSEWMVTSKKKRR